MRECVHARRGQGLTELHSAGTHTWCTVVAKNLDLSFVWRRVWRSPYVSARKCVQAGEGGKTPHSADTHTRIWTCRKCEKCGRFEAVLYPQETHLSGSIDA